MKKIVLLLTIIISVVAGYVAFKPKSMRVDSQVLQKTDFIESIKSEGRIKSKNRQVVYAFSSGNIQNLNVKLGDTVKRGQQLTVLHWDQVLAVKSPMDGVVTQVFRESAGPIERGSPIVEISSIDNLEVVVEILTTEAVKINIGTEALIQEWGGDGDLKARVRQVSKAGVTKVSALGVEEEKTELKLELENVPKKILEKLGDNYHVEVQFLLSKVEDVLTVPVGALFRDAERWSLYVVLDGKAHKRDIQVSLRNDSEMVVESGVNVGDRIILFPGDKIKDGTRVHYQ